MAGLLDFALGFGAGAAGAVAQDRMSQLEMQRKANLERLRAQYAGEAKERQITATADLLTRARGEGEGAQLAADRLTAMGVDWRQETRKHRSTLGQIIEDRNAALAAGNLEDAELLNQQIESMTSASDEATVAERTLESRISRLLRANPDWSYADAVREIEGVDRIITDPVTGRSSIVGRTATGEFIGRELQVDRPEPPPRRETPEPTQISDLAFDPGDGTGAFAVGASIYNSTLGQIPLLPVFTGVETAAQVLTVIQRDAVNMLASSGKPPVIEQERIVRMIPQPLEWSENPRIASLKLASFVDVVGLQYRADLDALDDPSLSQTERRGLNARVREIESIVGRMLTPEATERFLAQRDRPTSSEISEITSGYDEAIRTSNRELIRNTRSVFQAQIESGEIPQIPSILINEDMTEEEFSNLLDALGVEVGMSFIVPGYGPRTRR